MLRADSLRAPRDDADRSRKFVYTRWEYMMASGRRPRSQGFRVVSVTLALISTWEVGCSARDSSRRTTEAAESCEPGIRNDEWNVDCSAACNHVLACRASTGDSDLETLSCGDCLGSCVAGVSLGGNDLVEGSDEDRRSWLCAELVEGCSALDHDCDIF